MRIRKKDIDKNEIEKLCFIIIIEMESNRYEKLSSIDQRHFKKITYKQIVTKKDYGWEYKTNNIVNHTTTTNT